METTFSKIKALASVVLIAIFGVAGSHAGIVGQYTQTNTVGPLDLIFVQPVIGTNLGNNNITVSNLAKSDQMSSNRTLIHAHLNDFRNWYSLIGGISSTNGNMWLQVPNSLDFATIDIGDQLVSGAQQYIVTGKTNANQTLAFANAANGCSTQTAAPFTNYPVSFELLDSIPRRTGGFGGNSVFGAAGDSIGNNNGVWTGYYFWDGIYSAHMGNFNNGVNLPYFAISMGLGLGPGHNQQLCIELGSFSDDLVIKSNDYVALRRGVTNFFSTPWELRGGPIAVDGFTNLGTLTAFPTNIAGAGTASVVANNANFNVTVALPPYVYPGWQVDFGGGNVTTITHINGGRTSFQGFPASVGTASGISYTLISPVHFSKDVSNDPAFTITGDGDVYPNAQDTPRGGKYLFGNGTNSGSLSSVTEVDGPHIEYKNQFGQIPFGFSALMPNESFESFPDGGFSFAQYLTNKFGALKLAGTVVIPSTNFFLGSTTNLYPTLTFVQTNWTDGATYNNNTGCKVMCFLPYFITATSASGNAQEVFSINGLLTSTTPRGSFSIAPSGGFGGVTSMTNIYTLILSNGFSLTPTNIGNSGGWQAGLVASPNAGFLVLGP